VLLNTGSSPEQLSFSLNEIGLGSGAATLRDLWQPDDAAQEIAGEFASEVPAHGAMMYEVSGSEPEIPDGTVHLSDLTWTYAANGLGPVERDASNGGRATGDGEPISLRGTTFEKGLGVAAGSKILFRLARKCSRFQAVVGVDDAVGGKGSVTFQVFADGERLYPTAEPTPLSGSDDPQTLDLDLTGKYRLTLLVTSARDGSGNDRADWADAKITCAP
jgi:alpha-galactosidase